MQNAYWQMFVYISNLFALCTDWQKCDSSATGELQADIQITEMKLQALLFPPAARLPRRASLQAITLPKRVTESELLFFKENAKLKPKLKQLILIF